MIIREVIQILDDTIYRNYSDIGVFIRNKTTGLLYSDVNSIFDYEYEETDIEIEERDPPTEKQFQAAIGLRDILQRHFGEGAETNREVTMQYVKDYFVNKITLGTITSQDFDDLSQIGILFAIVEGYFDDGTTWSFYERRMSN